MALFAKSRFRFDTDFQVRLPCIQLCIGLDYGLPGENPRACGLRWRMQRSFQRYLPARLPGPREIPCYRGDHLSRINKVGAVRCYGVLL